jgi:hypothetical protein
MVGGRDRDRTCDFCRVKETRAPRVTSVADALHHNLAAQRPRRRKVKWGCTPVSRGVSLANLWHARTVVESDETSDQIVAVPTRSSTKPSRPAARRRPRRASDRSNLLTLDGRSIQTAVASRPATGLDATGTWWRGRWRGWWAAGGCRFATSDAPPPRGSLPCLRADLPHAVALTEGMRRAFTGHLPAAGVCAPRLHRNHGSRLRPDHRRSRAMGLGRPAARRLGSEPRRMLRPRAMDDVSLQETRSS